MVVRAKRALEDCRIALQRFENMPVADDFRLDLILCLTMLRVVGNVISREAAENGNPLAEANQTLWAIRSVDPIFQCFIEDFRNKVLKEYRACVGWSSIVSEDGHRMEYLVTEGCYEGEDVRELIAIAIAWWEQYLADLEALMSGNSVV